ncbi:MAG TPA: cyclase family protein [Pyrinomonadaceae bacterium]|jgi:arylformamidase|nr:cyclase family protein [Pyrinomonadaceae bacterium]
MPIFDISVAISPETTPTYPGDPALEIVSWAAIARGDAANVTLLRMGAHTATHVDAPAHFIEGAPQVSVMPLDALIGEARVVELDETVEAIEASHVAAHVPAGTQRVLFKTRNSNFWRGEGRAFRADFTHLTLEGARALLERGVRLVGIDYLSIEKFKSETFETHTTLLSAGVVIIEGLDLHAAAAGVYELICLPLKIAAGSGDGAPARAVLRTLP